MKEVAILMAVYKPNLDFFRQQLKSLDDQDYPNLKIYICDDSVDAKWFESIGKEVRSVLKNKPYILFQNTTNLGSSKTFERLSQLVSADYFAYCDQDDVWYPNKITQLLKLLESQDALLAYSDLRVIDAQNQELAPYFSSYNKRIQAQQGDSSQTFPFFIRRNCVTGCAMLISASVAKAAIPFNPDFIHDHWLALYASSQGRLAYQKEPLLDYRIHANNQIGKSLFKGIDDVESYLANKLLIEGAKNDKLKRLLKLDRRQEKALDEEIAFTQIRINWFQKRSLAHGFQLLSQLPKDPSLVCFEFGIRLLPKRWVKKVFQKIKQ